MYPSRWLAIPLLIVAGGCSVSVTKPGDLQAVTLVSQDQRVGNAYALRGFMGWWSLGMDQMAKEADDVGIRTNVFNDDQWSDVAQRICDEYHKGGGREPLVLMGHSFGADDSIRIARRLAEEKVPVDLLVTIDPVTPPAIPLNVKHALNIYCPQGWTDAFPWWRGIAVEAEAGFPGVLENINLRKDRPDLLEENTTHRNIEKNPKVQAEVMIRVLATCPPRNGGAAGRIAAATSPSASPATRPVAAAAESRTP